MGTPPGYPPGGYRVPPQVWTDKQSETITRGVPGYLPWVPPGGGLPGTPPGYPPGTPPGRGVLGYPPWVPPRGVPGTPPGVDRQTK